MQPKISLLRNYKFHKLSHKKPIQSKRPIPLVFSVILVEMGLKLCPKCEKPYLDDKEFCPNCPPPRFNGDADSYGSLGCVLISVLALVGMFVFWLFFIGSMFIH
jgi:hypothetical protein